MDDQIQVLREPTKDNKNYTLKILGNFAGRSINKYLHSKYDPIKEARRWAEDTYQEDIRVYIIYGCGYLYHIHALDELLKEQENKAKIIAVEPFDEVRELLRMEYDLKKKGFSDQVFIAKDFQEPALRKVMSNNIPENEKDRITVIVYAPYKDLVPAKEAMLIRTIKSMVVQRILNDNTTKMFKTTIPENIIKNIKYMIHAQAINGWKDYFSKKTAVIVSAGPSLEKNIARLQGYEDQALIITGGRSLKALLNHGIRPHFVCSLDPGEGNYQMYSKMNIFGETVPMISSFSNNHDIVELYNGEKIFVNDIDVDKVDQELFGKKVDAVTLGYTVAVLQISVAIYMGCRKIILVGQDCAFTDDKFHAEEASTVEETDNINRKDNTFLVRGNLQETVRTDVVLNGFREFLEEYIDNLDAEYRVINATEGGAYIEGTEVMTLAQALAELGEQHQDFHSQIEQRLRENHPLLKEQHLIKGFETMIENAKLMNQYAKEALVCAGKLSHDGHKNNPLIARMDKLDQKINRLKASTGLTLYYIQEEMKKINQTTDRMKDTDKDGIIEANRFLYESLMTAAGNMTQVLEEELGKIKKIENKRSKPI